MNVEEETVNFLLTIYRNSDNNKIKSHLITKCRKEIIQNKLKSIDRTLGAVKKRCSKCNLMWSEAQYTDINVLNKKLCKSRIKTLKRKLRSEGLQNKQSAIDKINGRFIERQCEFCHHKSLIPAGGQLNIKEIKQNKIKDGNQDICKNNKKVIRKMKSVINVYGDFINVPTDKQQNDDEPPPKKTKSKKKDKFAGLCQQAVLAAKSKNINSQLHYFLKPSL